MKISIVGGGPGALDLLTLRAIDCLKEAEVLVWTDSLICPAITDLAPENCERISTSSLTLEEILTVLIDRCKKGKKVVRLHDGDPCLYSTLAEQINGLSKEGIDVEVVPGISAYQATASALKAELTIPGITQTIVISRSGGRTGMPSNEKLEKLAAIGATLCLYLSARHIEDVEKELLKYYPKETLVAIGYRVTWEDEILKVVPLNQISSVSRENGFIRTTLFIVSPALNSTENRSKLYDPSHSHLFRKR